MSFKTLDPARQARSGGYQAGVKDGAEDAERVTSCPPIPALGHAEEMSWSWMYRQGYTDGYGDPVPHSCSKCQRSNSNG